MISTTFPGIDRDVAITGALLHDIGKLDAYTSDPLAIDLTDLGKLHGEIALGYYRIRREIEAIPAFPDELAAAVLHIILSHHGQLEHGSPVLPATREATLVHMIDNLGGKLGLVRPAGEGAAARLGLVGVRPSDRRRRLLRCTSSGIRADNAFVTTVVEDGWAALEPARWRARARRSRGARRGGDGRRARGAQLGRLVAR